jgi:hypothetical protein
MPYFADGSLFNKKIQLDFLRAYTRWTRVYCGIRASAISLSTFACIWLTISSGSPLPRSIGRPELIKPCGENGKSEDKKAPASPSFLPSKSYAQSRYSSSCDKIFFGFHFGPHPPELAGSSVANNPWKLYLQNRDFRKPTDVDRWQHRR